MSLSSQAHKYLFWAVCGLTLILPALLLFVSSALFTQPLLILLVLPGVLISWLAYHRYYGTFCGVATSIVFLIALRMILGLTNGDGEGAGYAFIYAIVFLPIFGFVIGFSIDTAHFFLRNKTYTSFRRYMTYGVFILAGGIVAWVLYRLISLNS
jgi:hypothetical protein